MFKKSTLVSAALASLTMASFSAKATENGTLDNWDQSSLVQEFSWCRIKIHRIEGHIDRITLEHKNKESGNASFHQGECNSIMLSVARGPESRVNFKKDVTTGEVWVDTVTGNRLTVDDNGCSVEDKIGMGLLIGEFDNDAREFVITDVKFGSDPPEDIEHP